MIHVSLQPVPGYLQLSLYKENIRMDHGVMGVSTSRGILTMVARQDKLSLLMIHVSLQPVPGYLQLSLYKENIRMDHECDGSIHL